VQVGPALEDRVVDRDRADDLADAAGPRLAHAQQADDVRAIGVEAKRPARARLVAGGHRRAGFLLDPGLVHGAVRSQLVAHLADQLTVRVLVACGAQVRADAPVELAQLVLGVARDGQAAQEHQPAAMLELVGDRGQLGAESGQRKILARDVGPGQAARLDRRQRGVELGDGGGRDRSDPVRRPRKIAAVPGGGPRERFHADRAHDGPLL